MAFSAIYLSIGFVQHERVLNIGRQVAAERGRQSLRLEAKPSFANLAVWKLVYETEQKFYVDAIKPGLFRTYVWVGSSAEKINLAEDFPWLAPHSHRPKIFSALAGSLLVTLGGTLKTAWASSISPIHSCSSDCPIMGEFSSRKFVLTGSMSIILPARKTA